MFKILVVEDDPVIAGAMESALKQWQYEVMVAKDFHDVLSDFSAFEPQLVLLDISLPFFNGFHWCTQIRQRSKVPIIFISSAADNMNMVMAMNLGADDFMSKPFDMHVFAAKVQAILRRTYAYGGQVNTLEHSGVLLNLTEATLSFNQSKIDLTKNEFKMLQVLMESPGKVISRSELMNRLWESDSFIDENTLTVNMTRLRKKLEDVGVSDWIQTKKGIGYHLKERLL
jgi:two-component system response regulator protein BraR/BceR